MWCETIWFRIRIPARDDERESKPMRMNEGEDKTTGNAVNALWNVCEQQRQHRARHGPWAACTRTTMTHNTGTIWFPIVARFSHCWRLHSFAVLFVVRSLKSFSQKWQHTPARPVSRKPAIAHSQFDEPVCRHIKQLDDKSNLKQTAHCCRVVFRMPQ